MESHQEDPATCRCGSKLHSRITHHSCPLNPKLLIVSHHKSENSSEDKDSTGGPVKSEPASEQPVEDSQGIAERSSQEPLSGTVRAQASPIDQALSTRLQQHPQQQQIFVVQNQLGNQSVGPVQHSGNINQQPQYVAMHPSMNFIGQQHGPINQYLTHGGVSNSGIQQANMQGQLIQQPQAQGVGAQQHLQQMLPVTVGGLHQTPIGYYQPGTMPMLVSNNQSGQQNQGASLNFQGQLCGGGMVLVPPGYQIFQGGAGCIPQSGLQGLSLDPNSLGMLNNGNNSQAYPANNSTNLSYGSPLEERNIPPQTMKPKLEVKANVEQTSSTNNEPKEPAKPAGVLKRQASDQPASQRGRKKPKQQLVYSKKLKQAIQDTRSKKTRRSNKQRIMSKLRREYEDIQSEIATREASSLGKGLNYDRLKARRGRIQLKIASVENDLTIIQQDINKLEQEEAELKREEREEKMKLLGLKPTMPALVTSSTPVVETCTTEVPTVGNPSEVR
uniref:Uncharacterized protein n=1 Tax=Mucochytrium quahogii TaxID=96639 RepID=A0A7S2S5S9_9STRA|mmetsp:Transcript_9359/g.15267  ORF Transcript_9359/g.15267 Transcript_9359/m.15267 type:complete len:501 (+) Transcript_9359:370-1872(+)|eukprot:CAMPEP_0203762358 /NCGR_PEP_ID=MMETSP0098-20131031/15264_1 /ASSEMBLY_ACC=CAM_ASM_000208 /TAXON_ID=96639 /ORGANISM=" , Strain NY0313808BC1" /LENGTH=500 /DNA_ID=CAMNT_0050656743 /DNA_START=325 /DNA_END=1827 /DNA_ORIENTATION=+